MLSPIFKACATLQTLSFNKELKRNVLALKKTPSPKLTSARTILGCEACDEPAKQKFMENAKR